MIQLAFIKCSFEGCKEAVDKTIRVLCHGAQLRAQIPVCTIHGDWFDNRTHMVPDHYFHVFEVVDILAIMEVRNL